MPASVPDVSGPVTQMTPLRYIDVAAGTGAPASAGQEYTVHYTGWLRDGTKFDSSRDRNEPLKFVQGRRHVIAGWETGFEGMKTGGRRRLFIPYHLAYGERGSGPIPPKAELVFDIELIDVKDVPERPAAADVLLPFTGLESKVLALAKAVPEEKYAWRPGPGVRSFGEVFLHIAYGNRLLQEVAEKQPAKDALQKLIAANAEGEKQPVTKEQVLRTLAGSFADVRKVLESTRAGRLNSDAHFFGQSTTHRGIFIALDTHVAEHMGQLIAYARMNGIAPPWPQAGQ